MKLIFTLFMSIIVLLPVPLTASQATSCPDNEMRVNGVCGDTSFAALHSGWNSIEPEGETVCAHGDPYRYWVRPGSTDKLLFHFEGGGGCWGYESCQVGSSLYDSQVEANEIDFYKQGIFDFDNPENPFSDYTYVFAPVCTGDVHTGNNTQVYESADGDEITIEHKGFVNSTATVQWAYDNIAEPESIFVTGCSAGSVGSIVFAPYIIEHYPDVPVYQLGDSLSFVFGRPINIQDGWHAHDNFPSWIPALGDIAAGEFTTARFYSAVANYYSDYTFSQYNSAHDDIQLLFYEAVGAQPENWTTDFEASIGEIHANAENFRSYTAAGTMHCITPRNAFYTYETEGVRFVDWVADLAGGRDIETIHCTDCD